MFAGKQIHPFFSSWKGGKKNQDMIEVDNIFCAVGRKDKSITIGPIHVFEKLEDEVVSIDWSNWTFSEKNLTNASYCMESTMPSAFGGSVVSLTFNKLPCVPHPWEESQNVFSDHCHVKKHMHETSSAIPVILLEDCEVCCQLHNGVSVTCYNSFNNISSLFLTVTTVYLNIFIIPHIFGISCQTDFRSLDFLLCTCQVLLQS